MDSVQLSPKTLAIIGSYRGFSCQGVGAFSVPYYNNRRGKIRAGLRSWVGKGSPADICEEVELLLLRDKTSGKDYSPETMKQFLVDRYIGIDCSGFVYHALNEESIARGKGSLRAHLTFPFTRGIRKLFVSLRCAENADVKVFAHNANSHVVALDKIAPGDFITMTHTNPEQRSHDHIILVHAVVKNGGALAEIHYTHSIAWPTDGRYHHGVRQGKIIVADRNRPLVQQSWEENDKTGSDNFTHERARGADNVEIRRLNWF